MLRLGHLVQRGVRKVVKFASVVVLVPLVVCACAGDAPISSSTTPGSTAPAAADTSVAAREVRLSGGRIAPKPLNWTLTFGGAEQLYARMSLNDAVISMQGDLWQTNRSVTCSYFRAARAPGMRFVFLRWKLVRIEVDSGAVATAEGIRIGSTEAQVHKAYPDRVTVTDDVFTGGHFLSVAPAEGMDTTVRIVFDTDGQRVTRFRSGLRYAVEWAEGCS